MRWIGVPARICTSACHCRLKLVWWVKELWKCSNINMASMSLMFIFSVKHTLSLTMISLLLLLYLSVCAFTYVCICAQINICVRVCQRLSSCTAVVKSPPVLMRAWRFACLSLKPIELSCSSSSWNSASSLRTWQDMTWQEGYLKSYLLQ